MNLRILSLKLIERDITVPLLKRKSAEFRNRDFFCLSSIFFHTHSTATSNPVIDSGASTSNEKGEITLVSTTTNCDSIRKCFRFLCRN